MPLHYAPQALGEIAYALQDFAIALVKLTEAFHVIDQRHFSEADSARLSGEISRVRTSAQILVERLTYALYADFHWRTRAKIESISGEAMALAQRLALLELALGEPSEAASPKMLRSALTFAADDVSAAANKYLQVARRYSTKVLHHSPSFPSVESRRRRTIDSAEPGTTVAYDLSPVVDPTESTMWLTRVVPSGAPQESYAMQLATLVPVMFATDRKVAPSSRASRVEFSDGRGKGELTYGIAEVSIPPIHRIGRIEQPQIWKFQIFEDVEKHVVMTEARVQSFDEWREVALRQLETTEKKAALVFIHGFNVSFEEAIRCAAQIGHDIRFPGLITCYSWSSENNKTGYLADAENVELTAPLLQEYLVRLAKDVGVEEIHLIAHSMGNRALIRALGSSVPNAACISEVIFAAPDVDADLFKKAIGSLRGKAKRYTLYGSENDVALIASKQLRKGYPRAGDGGHNVVVMDGVETIDASAVGGDILGLGHSYFSSKRTLLNDLYYVIRESLPPGRRSGLKPQPNGDSMYWIFQP